MSNFDISHISKLLPHRYPFLLVDKIIKISENEIIGIKNVTINEPFFQGHFPQNPVMPGVLQVEALIQTGGILGMQSVKNPNDYWTYFLGIDKCKFKKIVIPGDILKLHCMLINPLKRGILKVEAKSYVDDQITCQCELTAMLSLKNK